MKQPTVISFGDHANHASITETGTFGGLIGSIDNNSTIVMTISNSANNGNATGNGYDIGGLVGIFGMIGESVSVHLMIAPK